MRHNVFKKRGERPWNKFSLMKINSHFDKKVQTAIGVGKVKENTIQEGESRANFPRIGIWWPSKTDMVQQASQSEGSTTTVRS